MRFCSISLKLQKHIACIDLGGGRVLSLPAALKRWGFSDVKDFGSEHNSSMLSFLRATETRPDILNDLHERIENRSFHDSDVFEKGSYTWEAPVVPDRNLMCVGKNYSDHINEINRVNAKKETTAASGQGQVTPAESISVPVFFTKAPQTVVAHGADVECHANVTKWLDYEVELAVVIGRTIRDVSEEDAMQSVFGYTIANDVTAREVQKRHIQWFKGKSLDTTCPLGPSIVHAATNPHVDPTKLQLSTWINGDLRQHSTTDNLIFKIPRLISELSKGFTLLPGDVILTGTPDGVGYAMEPPQVLKPGDRMLLEIEHLGQLENRVVD